VLNPLSVRTSRPALTIGVPVFNAERYLAEALDSLLAQTYRDFILILCDNCSTDRTPEICQGYAARDPRVRYHRNDHNLGAAKNFNLVFERSSTSYFKWAPYDDRLEPEFLSRCIEVLETNPSVVLCYSKAKIIDENGDLEGDYDPGPDTSSLKPQGRFRNLLLRPEYAIQQMGVIRSDVLRRTALHGSFPSSDEVLLAELSLLGAFREVADRLYLYRRHSAQSTRQPKQRDRVLFMDTSLEGKIVLPTWRYFLACGRAVNKGPLGAVAQTQCYFAVLRWAARPDHFRALLKDLLLAVGKYLSSALSRFRRAAGRESVGSAQSGLSTAKGIQTHGR
jgi:glycosyltransferase involved in cell wall biosynthesis